MAARCGNSVVSAVSAQVLLDLGLTLWPGNRPVDAGRVAQIVEAFRRHPAGVFAPQPIIAARLDGRLLLVDGQHRHAAIAALGADAVGAVFYCEVQCETEAELRLLFQRVNSGVQVAAIFTNGLVKSMVGEYIEWLCRTFAGAVATGETCHRPRFIPTHVAEQLTNCNTGAIQQAVADGTLNAATLIRATLAENECARAAAIAGEDLAKSPKCTKCAQQTGFYLGLRKLWAGRVINTALGAAGRMDAAAD